MQIECATTRAAAEVVSILLSAYLWPGREFRITSPRPPDPPIRLTLSVNLPAHVVRRVQGIPDIRIADERGA